MNRTWWIVGAVLTAVFVALLLSNWNDQRVSCEARHGVLARTLTGFACVAEVNEFLGDGGSGEPLSMRAIAADDLPLLPPWRCVGTDEILDGDYVCRKRAALRSLPANYCAIEADGSAQCREPDGAWSKKSCKAGQFLTGSGDCGWLDLTEFVPDLPERMSNPDDWIFATNVNTAQLATFTGTGDLRIDSSSGWIKCMYYDGRQVEFLLFAERARYDQTGSDGPAPPPLDTQARDVLMQLFGQLVEAADDTQDLIELARVNIRQNHERMRAQRTDLQSKVERLTKRRKRLKYSGTERNFLDDLLGQKITQTTANVERIDKAIGMGERALEMLAEFAYEPEKSAIVFGVWTTVAWPGTSTGGG